jgi:hypothetical protein
MTKNLFKPLIVISLLMMVSCASVDTRDEDDLLYFDFDASEVSPEEELFEGLDQDMAGGEGFLDAEPLGDDQMAFDLGPEEQGDFDEFDLGAGEDFGFEEDFGPVDEFASQEALPAEDSGFAEEFGFGEEFDSTAPAAPMPRRPLLVLRPRSRTFATLPIKVGAPWSSKPLSRLPIKLDSTQTPINTSWKLRMWFFLNASSVLIL